MNYYTGIPAIIFADTILIFFVMVPPVGGAAGLDDKGEVTISAADDGLVVVVVYRAVGVAIEGCSGDVGDSIGEFDVVGLVGIEGIRHVDIKLR